MSGEDVALSHLRALRVASDRNSIIKGLSKNKNKKYRFSHETDKTRCTGFRPGLGPQVAQSAEDSQLCCLPRVSFLLSQLPLMEWAGGCLQFQTHILSAQQSQWEKRESLPQQFSRNLRFES